MQTPSHDTLAISVVGVHLSMAMAALSPPGDVREKQLEDELTGMFLRAKEA